MTRIDTGSNHQLSNYRANLCRIICSEAGSFGPVIRRQCQCSAIIWYKLCGCAFYLVDLTDFTHAENTFEYKNWPTPPFGVRSITKRWKLVIEIDVISSLPKCVSAKMQNVLLPSCTLLAMAGNFCWEGDKALSHLSCQFRTMEVNEFFEGHLNPPITYQKD